MSHLQKVMKRLLTYLTISIASLLMLSCGKENGQNEKNNFVLNRADIIGCWQVIQAKYDENATMTAWTFEDTYATFEENGLYKGEGYWGNGTGTYSVAGNVITTKVDNVPYIIYEVTGLEDDKAYLIATVQKNQMKVWLVCQKVKNLDLEPQNPTTDENYFNQESQVRIYISAIYNDISKFAEYKLSVEEKVISGNFEVLSPTNSEINEAWTNAYNALNKINNGLNALEHNGNGFVSKYIPHLHALRAFISYNLASLWGDVPYMPDDPSDVFRTIRKAEDVLKCAINDIELYSSYTFADAAYYEYFNPIARQLLHGEIELTRGNLSSAKDQLSINLDNQQELQTSDIIFYLRKLKENGDIDIIALVYFKAGVELLRKEANGNVDGLVDLWKDGNHYGYWQMLKRIGKAQEVTGCQQYQLLFPYPQNDANYWVHQNEGY